MIRIDWEYPEVPEYDPDIHDPEKVFAFMCYRGVHYAKWAVSYTHLRAHET